MCLGARDPYCGWDRKQRCCTTIEDSSNMSQWFQNITACPVSVERVAPHNWLTDLICFGRSCPFIVICAQVSVNRVFSLQWSWLQKVILLFYALLHINMCFLFQLRNQTMDGAYGPWTPWQPCSHDDGDGTSSCLCRSRACDSPPPLCGGKMCEGPTIEVTNCSR